MSLRRVLLVAALCLAVAVAGVHASEDLLDQELEAPQLRTREHIDAMAQEIGLVELSADADAAAEASSAAEEARDLAEAQADLQSALSDISLAESTEAHSLMELESEVESEMETETEEDPYNTYTLDESDLTQHVWVEAKSNSGISTMKTKSKLTAAAQKAVNAANPIKEITYLGNPINAKELLVVFQEPEAGHTALPNTFRDAPVLSAKPESKRVLKKRMRQAKKHLRHLAKEEHEMAEEEYKEKMKRFEHARAVEHMRQSQAFERPLQAKTVNPHPASNAATFNGDRNHNTLFPAATALSDGKASSQNHDFHHAGAGDMFADHTGLVEQAQQSTSTADADADADQIVTEEMPAGFEVVADAAPAGFTLVTDPSVVEVTDEEAAAPSGPAAEEEATEEAAPAEEEATPAAAATEEAPATEVAPVEGEDPSIAPVPCSAQCAADKDAWQTAACQDCLVRGMVNGWIVRSIMDRQAGYNYAHYARNQCVMYANELRLRTGVESKGAPFSHCFFQKMHESCNL